MYKFRVKVAHDRSTMVQEWLEELLMSEPFVGFLASDEVYVLIWIVVQTVNETFRTLYSSGAWLDSETGQKVGKLGLRSLRAYRRLADIFVERRTPRFPVHTKMHQLYHTFRGVEQSSSLNSWSENPLIHCCQQDEAFVGIICRHSRRVSPGSTVDRTWDVHKVSLNAVWDL